MKKLLQISLYKHMLILAYEEAHFIFFSYYLFLEVLLEKVRLEKFI